MKKIGGIFEIQSKEETMSDPLHMLKTDRPAERAESENLRGCRLVVSCRVSFFAAEGFEGEATLLNVSTGGCRLSSSVVVYTGMVLRLSIFLSDHPWPLIVEEAIIRWVDGPEFGLKFLTLRAAQRERLRALFEGATQG